MQRKSPSTKIQTQRLTLRRRIEFDAYSGFECIDSDRVRLREFLPWVDASTSVDNQVWYINECLKEWEAGTLFDYGIFIDKDYIGNIGIHNIRWDHHGCEVGYWLHGKHEGQGYITEALLALEKEIAEVGFHRIEIRCDPRNKKSAAVPLRNGYQYEGTLRDYFFSNGSYRDTEVYAKLLW